MIGLLAVVLAAAPGLALGDASAAGVTATSAAGVTTLRLDGAAFHATTATVRNLRTVPVAGSDVVLALWNEDDGAPQAYYAISLDGQSVAAVRATSYSLELRHGAFDPAFGEPGPRGDLAARGNCNLYLVQYVTQPLPEFRALVEQFGGVVRGFVPNHAQIVEMPADTRDAVAALPFVRWVGSYHPAYRLEEVLRDSRETVEARFPVQRYVIRVFETGARQKQTVADRIETLGGVVDSRDFGKQLIVATLTPDELYEVVQWNEVMFIDRWSPLQPDMDNIRAMGGANYLETATGFAGQGVRGEVFDAGFNVSHVDFASRPLILHGQVGSDSHGAATSGIVFGDGTGNPAARGMLPAGQGIIGDYNYIGLEGPSRYQHTGEQVQPPYWCVFETASVGSDRVTTYTNISADTDDALFDFDILHCQSQSNAGDQMSRPQAWAKNILSGGGVYHYNNQNFGDDCWCSGASIGPASDGRIKPDLCAAYDAILTCSTGSPTAYTTDFGGTSGATPIIAGHCGLFFQMWAAGLFGNEVDPNGSVFDNRPHMTTAKAVMINNGRQYTFSGTTGDLTRVHQGWGWPDVRRIYDMREKLFIINESELITNLQTIEYVLNVEPGETEFKATMTYADPAGNPGTGPVRINDLTLQVVAPDGTTYWGNNGLLSGNYSTPGGSANHVDTVENVFVQNPASGPWLVRVIAEEVVQDSHVETPELDADFALVVSGVVPCSSRGSARLTRGIYACSGAVQARVLDCDLNLDPNVIETVTVTVVSTTDPAGEALLLTESGPSTASFSGTVALGGGSGELLVANGDVITLTYIDADDGLGGTNVVVTDTADVDCLAPSIADVQAINIEPRDAQVTFNSNEPVRATVHYGLSCGSLNQSASSSVYDVAPVVAIDGLEDNTTYYFSVEAEDLAGNVTVDANCYTFTTPEVPDFFTEIFESNNNDLDNISLVFTPNNSVDFYHGCAEAITTLPTDPAGGTALTFSSGDDGYAQVTLGGGATVSLYGVSYNTFWVGTNGYLTFGSSDTDYTETLADHFAKPRIAACFDDLNPGAGGQVSWKQLADRVAVTYLNVYEYSTNVPNTFQFELFFDGTLKINYLVVNVQDGLAGLSRGLGLSPDFLMSDLSNMGVCEPTPPQANNGSGSTPLATPVTLTLVANDDGLPDPPGVLSYLITALPQHGTLTDPNGWLITTVPYTLLAQGNSVTYAPSAVFVGSDTFQFKANDGGEPPQGGDSNIATVTVSVYTVPEVIYSLPLDTDPGWTTEGAWAFGQPTGGGSHARDPNSGFTGLNVYGYNLAGDYTNSMPARNLTTTAFDLSGVSGVTLKFQRRLGVEASDDALIKASNNGSTWVTIWDSNNVAYNEAGWTAVSYDLSAVADNQPTVYIRWVIGPTDISVTYPGWNIDDVELWGMVPPEFAIGDLNCDGFVGFGDINPFVMALTSPSTYATQFPDCDIQLGDVNGNGSVGFDDINPFVSLLTNP